MPGVGDEFRAAREARHLSLSDVSEQIHIRSVYLQSIEDEDYGAIGAPVYVRGFIRTYARFLSLDPERAVEAFNGSAGRGGGTTSPATDHGASYAALGRGRRPSAWIWGGIVVAAILVGFVGYNLVSLRMDGARAPVVADATAAPSPAASSATPSPTPTVVATAKPVAVRTMSVRLTQSSWLLVTIDGKHALEGTYPAGTRKSFVGDVAQIRAGNAGGVELTVNGRDLGTMGHSGDVVTRRVALAKV